MSTFNRTRNKGKDRAQVSIEYLLTITFAVVLIIAVTIIAFSIAKLSDQAQLDAINNRDKSISSLMS